MPAPLPDPLSDPAGWTRLPSTATHVGGALYAPPGAKGAPLLVALHGCAQTAGDFAAGTGLARVAAAAGFATLFPETDRTPATVGLNPFGCWLWWARENQGRGGEPARIVALADAAARAAEGAIDASRFCVAGLSSGAAMAAILGAVWPDRVAAIACHAGVAYSAAEVETPTLPAWATGRMEDGTTILSFTPLNMMKLKAWASESLGALAKADDDHADDAAEAVAARAGAAGYAPALIVHGAEDRIVDPAHARQLALQALQIADLADDGDDDQSVDTRADAKEEGKGGRGGYPFTRWDWRDDAGRLAARLVRIGRLGHAWSGGHPAGGFTDPLGPDASALTVAFFAEVRGG
jgi:poly(hydroxyalkanoate) depolymerase family esterase